MGEHADKDEIGIVDPVKRLVRLARNPRCGEVGFDRGDESQIRVQVVGLVLFGRDVGDGGFSGGWVGRDEDPVVGGGPVGAHHDDVLDAGVESGAAHFFPVVRGVAVFAEHHC